MADDIKTHKTDTFTTADEPDPGYAVTSTTETVPHPADATSSPGPYDDLPINRPPVSTNEPQTPIAHSLIAGAGAPQPTEGPLPEDWEPDGNGGAKVKDEAKAKTKTAKQAPAAEAKKAGP